ncbi:glycoside hydrolase family 2 TIM barrel-domain containing protein [Flammeovirga kamogawensis]|uniref:beta-galactosidase n=1 Tax=Flammeovirga kamogawensis TaxID=373891 RepID=A0ABX8H1M3_9BACT|nr:glycoside hydrolase family 2 TIM barrel-domain containing protein [Flammeovirga kamogawensis]MBB6462412.1 beta-galactosidase [Flammeovirga kamogawensis]QWG09524.1 DUF4981 domain-containing protein [Flammeovirga kamogawensis]TRX65040.1 DUF4981 domain-containing protein [Flammeovirga kamogawensis]
MHKILLTYFICLLPLIGFTQGRTPHPYIENPAVIGINKMAPRAAFFPFENELKALNNTYEASANYQTLNGKWKFKWVKNETEVPQNFYSSTYNHTDWALINVPANWEVEGFGTPIYTNDYYPFADTRERTKGYTEMSAPKPPFVPIKNNPVGLYFKEFELRTAAKQQDIILHIGAIKSAAFVYINGKEIGYTQGSKVPSEFNITSFLKEGKNTIAFKVFRWSDASYLECQDFWRLSGIERDVFLIAQNKVSIQDFGAITTLKNEYKDGDLALDITLNNSSNKTEKVSVSYQLFEGKVLDLSKKPVIKQLQELDIKGGKSVHIKQQHTIINAAIWSAEKPSIYTLLITLKKDNKIIQSTSERIGFRSAEIKDGLFLVNGKPIIVKGVNLHEHNAYTGHVIDEKLIRKDIKLMKQLNINAIRTSHYPQPRKFYELCTEFGMYVVDEANIESHGMGYSLQKGKAISNNPSFEKAIVDRTRRMYERDKNYPCIVTWSLGNESGNGYNFYQSYNYLKSVTTIPVQYERAGLEWNTDIYCPMYAGHDWMEKYAKEYNDRPLIQCEYEHFMGNSGGGFEEYTALFDKYENLQGGFIWDWVDQGLHTTDKDGNAFLAYGADFGPENVPSDGSFLANGIVDSDRNLKPSSLTVKKGYQNVKFKATDLSNGKFEMKNWYDFTSMDKFTVEAVVKADGKIVHSFDAMHFTTAPHQTEKIRLSIQNLPKGKEYFIHFSVVTNRADSFKPKGYAVATAQFKLPSEIHYTNPSPTAVLTLKETKNEVQLSNKNVLFLFSKDAKTITSYKYKGIEYIHDNSGLTPSFWRALTCNDMGAYTWVKAKDWKVATQEFTIKEVKVSSKTESAYELLVTYNLPAVNTTFDVLYTVFGDGALQVNAKLNGIKKTDKMPELLRVGMRMMLPKAFNNMTYFGRGPEENYSDRNWATDVDLYNKITEDVTIPFIRPQEMGNHTDIRWVAMKNKKGQGLIAVSNGKSFLNTSAMNYTDEALDAGKEGYDYPKNLRHDQRHPYQIEKADFVQWHLDMVQEGVGGVNTWGARAMPKYMLDPSKDYEYAFTLIPFKKANTAQLIKMSKLKYTIDNRI